MNLFLNDGSIVVCAPEVFADRIFITLSRDEMVISSFVNRWSQAMSSPERLSLSAMALIKASLERLRRFST